MSIEESFKGMTSALDVDYVHDEVESEKLFNTMETKKNEIVQKVQTSTAITLEDQEYMQFELKSLIQGGMTILEVLSQDIKIGTKPSTHEAYFNGLDKVGKLVRELRDLNLSVKKLEIDEIKAGNTKSADVSVTHKLDGRAILKMLKKVKEESVLNTIDADFKVDDKEWDF